MKLVLKLSLCLCLLIGVSMSSYAQQKQSSAKTINIPARKIIDKENIFTQTEITALELQIQDFIKTTKIPMSIMVMPNNSEKNNQWSIGTYKNPKGVVFMISKSSKEVSIGVGKELTKTLTKNKVDDIINTSILTAFKRAQYATGISNSIKALLAQLVH